MNKMIIGVIAVLVVIAGVVGVSAMTKKSSTSSTANQVDSNKHNPQDVMFAQMMIPHHEQAVEMAALAETRASNTEVKKLAADIKGAQDPEIKTMTDWLKGWGEDTDIPVSTDPGMSGHDMGATVSGMMTMEDMDKLKAARGAEFDKMFMTMMIEHHNGAIEMAKTEQFAGQYGPAKDLADKIISAQEGEIKKMNELLKG